MDEGFTEPADAVRKAVDELHLLIAAQRLYGEKHKHTRGVFERFADSLRVVHEEHGDLDLQVSHDSLSWRSEIVYQDSDDREGLARTLHREGIVRISIDGGVAEEELLRFSEVLGLNLNLPAYEEETLPSLLWQANLQNIVYEAVEYLSDAQELSERAARGGGDQGSLLDQIMETPASAGTSRPVDGEGLSGDGETDPGSPAEIQLPTHVTRAVAMARSQMSMPTPQWSQQQKDVEAELARWAEAEHGELDADADPDLEALRQEIAGDDEATMLQRIVDVLLVAGARGRGELQPDEAMVLLDHVLRWEPGGGPSMLKSVMVRVMRLLDGSSPLVQEGKPAMDRWLDMCTKTDRFIDLIEQVDRSNPVDIAVLRKFLTGNQGRRAQLVVERLAGNKLPQRHSWVMDEVAQAVQNHIAALSKDLEHRPVDEAVAVIELLRRLGGAPAQMRLFELLRHDSPDVRAEAIRALPYPIPDWMLTQLVDMLDGRDEVVRKAVVHILKDQESAKAWNLLEARVKGDEFRNATPERKRSLAQALAALAPGASVPVLAAILERSNGMFAGGDPDDLEAAAQALADIGTVAARQPLIKGSKSLNRALRRACKNALKA